MGVHQRIERHQTVQQIVMAFDINTGTSALNVSLGRDAVQIPAVIAQVVNMDVGIHRSTGREEVGALSLGCDVSRHGIDGALGHQVADIQALHLHVGIVAHGIGIEASFQRNGALVLTHRHVGKIVRTIGL